MLRGLANSVLRWALAGILGATSLLGSELHELFGIHHAGEVRRCAGSGLAGQSGASVAAGHAQSCDDGAICPICNYLAQGRVVGERFEGVSVAVSVPERSPAIPLFLPSPHLRAISGASAPAA